MTLEIRTQRLRLSPATEELLRLELDDAAAFAARLGSALPEDWPPGEYDRGAIEFFLKQTVAGGESATGWYGWYVLLDEDAPDGCQLIGCGGYLGPPDADGVVEIGYSLCEKWRGRGLAKEVVSGLVENAWRRGARSVQAHTSAGNAASIAVLRGCGFQTAPCENAEQLRFELSR